MNECGLNVESLGPGAQGTHTQYVPAGEGDYNQQNILAFILANARDVDEAIELVKKTKVETSALPVAHDIEVGLHYSITDKDKAIERPSGHWDCRPPRERVQQRQMALQVWRDGKVVRETFYHG